MEPVEELAEGQTVVRDEQGKFAKVRLSPERARQLSERSHMTVSKQRISDGRALEVADAILAAMTPLADPQAEGARRVLVEEAARLAAESKGQVAMSAIQSLARQVGESFSAMQAPAPGMQCRLCGQTAGRHAVEVKIAPEASVFVEAMWTQGEQVGIEEAGEFAYNACREWRRHQRR